MWVCKYCYCENTDVAIQCSGCLANKNPLVQHNWYCYVCGKILRNNYYLLSMNTTTDRVFLCCNECIKSVKDVLAVQIKELE